MKKLIVIFSIIVAVVLTAFGFFQSLALASDQSGGVIPRGGDLCSGTGGIGKIVSLGTDAFTMKRNDDGLIQTVHLASQATIETSTGTIPLSGLTTGERVTLVGRPNVDGSFTANMVVVCAAAAAGAPTTMRVKSADVAHFTAVVTTLKILLFGLMWLGIILFLWLKKKGLVYLLFFTIFYVYLYKVLDYTLFQFQTLVFEQYFVPGLMLKGVAAGKILNLIPLVTLTLKDVKTSLLNIIMMMPFGFGLPFITNLRMKEVVMIGMFFSIGIECLQFITGFIGKMTFRIADINDVIFNTVGVAIGYLLFVTFVRMFHHVTRNWKISANPILRYIADRPQV